MDRLCRKDERDREVRAARFRARGREDSLHPDRRDLQTVEETTWFSRSAPSNKNKKSRRVAGGQIPNSWSLRWHDPDQVRTVGGCVPPSQPTRGLPMAEVYTLAEPVIPKSSASAWLTDLSSWVKWQSTETCG